MDKIFRVELHNGDRAVEIWLPATGYQLLDIMDKLQINEAVWPSIAVLQYDERFENLEEVMGNDLNLFALNALAVRLSQFDLEDVVALHALVSVRLEAKRGEIPLRELLGLAYSTDRCDVRMGVESYEELGHFYVENGMVPELSGVPEEALQYLNYEEIGKKLSGEEGGILVPGGYVTQTSELMEFSRSVELCPLKPDYSILLEVSKGYFNDPAYDNDKRVLLSLPATPQELGAALDAIDAWDWREVGFCCLDHCVPALIDSIESDDNIDHINHLAGILKKMPPKQFTKFKAVLDATQNYSVSGAIHIANTLDDYLFTPQYATARDMARDYIISSIGEFAASELFPFVQLEQYGRALMEADECALTDYGMVSREDGQCLKTSLSPAGPVQAGMEMK